MCIMCDMCDMCIIFGVGLERGLEMYPPNLRGEKKFMADFIGPVMFRCA